MSKKYNERSVIYNDMRGVDLSLDGSNISKHRFAYLENMYRDYDGEGAGIVESIPGYRKIYALPNAINGLFSYKTKSGVLHLAVHSGGMLYDLTANDPDSVTATSSLTGVRNTKSAAITVGDALYLLDGERIFKFRDGTVRALDENDEDIYVPTAYYNGARYEQFNLLTRRFCEIFNVGSCDASAYGSPGIRYLITDADAASCEVIGYGGTETDICIPSRVLIGDRYYYVKSIGKNAFKNNTYITSCKIAAGVSYIGIMAFNSCTALTSLILPDTVTEIANAAFAGCLSLSEFHLSASARKLGNGCFNTCPKLTSITYGGTASEFSAIVNTSALSGIAVAYEHKVRSATVEVIINSPCSAVSAVTVGDIAPPYRVLTEDGLCKSVIITLDDKSLFHGKDVRICGTLSESTDKYTGENRGFISSCLLPGDTVCSVILACTVAENFDGRVFYTGNKKYPGFCFYSSSDLSGENNPLYLGDMNYFRDGSGSFGNTALLAAGDSLAVFKEDDDGSGSVYYHTPHDTGTDLLPRIYPVSYIHSGITAKGAVVSFFDDPIFISEMGVTALAKKQINLQRSVAVRSTNVNPRLLREKLSEAALAVWRGYLAVLTEGRIYLADSRATFEGIGSALEYEWYYLSGIGSYSNDSRVYRYASVSHTGYDVHRNTDEIATGTVYSVKLGEESVFYVIEGDRKYEVYPTGELVGGSFSPANCLLAVGDLLFFGTRSGDVLLFNNDKRGAPPPHVKKAEGFDADEYARSFGGVIHPYYYSFAGHAPRYALRTKRDDCSLPHLEKSTVKGSLAIKCRAAASGSITCEVGCDGVGYREIATFPSSALAFGEIDFSNLSLTTDDVYTVPVNEKAKGWIEKQISVYTDSFASPFGIYTIAYRFFVKGKIKKGR